MGNVRFRTAAFDGHLYTRRWMHALDLFFLPTIFINFYTFNMLSLPDFGECASGEVTALRDPWLAFDRVRSEVPVEGVLSERWWCIVMVELGPLPHPTTSSSKHNESFKVSIYPEKLFTDRRLTAGQVNLSSGIDSAARMYVRARLTQQTTVRTRGRWLPFI